MSNYKYDKENVLIVIADYIMISDETAIQLMSAEQLYDRIVDFAAKKYKSVLMPKFSQARKMVISRLIESNHFHEGERFTSEVISRLKECYYSSDDIMQVLINQYKIECYAEQAIICTLSLPSKDEMQRFSSILSTESKKSELWCKIDTIREICTRIKDRDPNSIIAVIPECNRMVYLDKNGMIDINMSELDPLCDTLCMFVKYTPEGQALVDEMIQHHDWLP